MALKTTVKVGSINNLSDARYCAGIGVDILGFCFESTHEKFIEPTAFLAISEWLSGVQYMAEFPTYSFQQIEESLALYEKVQHIQTDNSPELPFLQSRKESASLSLDAGKYKSLGEIADTLQDCHQEVTYFVLENPHNSANLTLDDALHLAEQYPILLGFGITPENILSLVDNSAIAGIALKGSEEIKPGYKDFDDLAEILEVLEVDEAY
ncbi:phosphoribosylanthranilate isomerase [Tunicatimonas pelagia]|uniref:phosphoribosylanthranilate isomerase n=1 Tax=Tunicatimonas pelagia TaxID=931531 RepID=UPI0026661FAC|nr:phosphoribosylanthranilate isomerase [Tunicatimonas pelagia]WKN44645.1 phosphoribosylanthranilate isomerase [Tunicatimonas pelagia]